MTKDEQLGLLLIMLKCTEDKTRKEEILSSYIEVNGPIPMEYANKVFEALEGEKIAKIGRGDVLEKLILEDLDKIPRYEQAALIKHLLFAPEGWLSWLWLMAAKVGKNEEKR